jgi:hypothetical protein
MRETSGSGQATDVAIGSVAANNTEFLLIEGDYTVPNNLAGLSLVAQGAGFSLDHVQVYEYMEPKIVASVTLAAGTSASSLNWNAELASSYTLQKSTDLATWTDLETLTAYESAMSAPVSLNPGESEAFWRVVSSD